MYITAMAEGQHERMLTIYLCSSILLFHDAIVWNSHVIWKPLHQLIFWIESLRHVASVVTIDNRVEWIWTDLNS